MTVRLPFTLTPHEGQDFVSWLDAYAARLGVTRAELADALGLPDHLPFRTAQRDCLISDHHVLISDHHVEAIAAASGLGVAAIEAMLTAVAPAAPGRQSHRRARGELSVVERLRRASTVSPRARLEHVTTVRRRRSVIEPDPALGRAKRLPDQLWAAWAIRLVDDDAFEASTFRSSMLAALLVVHSSWTLKDIAVLVGERVQPAGVAFHLRKLVQVTQSAVPLQMLTELAFAIDTHELPIDYARRRQMAAGTKLIDARTWTRLARAADARSGGPRRVRFARRYLYEVLTGCSLHHAPTPYRIEGSYERIEYHDFVAGLPRALVEDLHTHAFELLDAAGISDEPLQWEPPTSWVSVTDWPGAEPELTDPEPIHRALRAWRARHSQVAASLGISTEHLRHVIRQHPRPSPATPSRRVLVPSGSSGQSQIAGPKAISLDPQWLRHEYLIWRRPLPDIAAQLGCRVGTLRKFALEHGIALRSRSGPEGFAHLDLPGLHPSEVPEPLRSVLVGHDARQRLARFVVIAEHPSLTQAARTLGAHQCTLTNQLQHLASDCGGLLLQRHPRPRPVGPLTSLGEQLHRQALDHFPDIAA